MVKIENKEEIQETSKPANAPLITRYKLQESPLEVVGNEEKGYTVVMGKHRLLEWFKSEEELKIYIGENWLNLVTSIVATMIVIANENTEFKNPTNNFEM